MTESLELRLRAESWRMLAEAYELHVMNLSNSPTARTAYEAALKSAMDAEDALTSAADVLDERAGFRLPFSRADVRAVEIVAPVRVVS